jgi:type VI secretion system secreted protein VgrG
MSYDPYGLLNRVKTGVGYLNIVNSYRLGLQSRFFGVISVMAFGLGQPEIGIPAAAMAAWKMKSAQSAAMRGGKQIAEGADEDPCKESYRNLMGLAPFGDKFDDVSEPYPHQIDIWNNYSAIEILGEIGTGF